MIEEGLVVFNSTHDAIKADDICATKDLGASLIPTHPSISAGCGLDVYKRQDFERIFFSFKIDML